MKVYGLCRLTKEPELKHSTSGTAYLMCSVACNRNDKDKTTDFFNIKAFGKTAETMGKFLHKGSKILVEGTLQNDIYEKDGVKKTTTSISVSSWEFAESKGEKTESKPNNDFLNVAAGVCEEELPFS